MLLMTTPEARAYRLPRQVTDSVETRRDYLSSRLQWNFGAAIGDLSLSTLVHPRPKTKRLRTLDQYSLVQVLPSTPAMIDHKGRTFYGRK